MKAIRKVLARLRRADIDYNLISSNDVIVLGISLGKDSMVLFEAMQRYQKYIKKDFKIIPVTIDLGFPNFKISKMKKYFLDKGYELKVVDAKDVYKILLKNQKEKIHLPCSICSRMKKAIINKTAHELKANKVAFAHHLDDASETLFMNILYSGKIATFEPKMHLSKENIDFIRPLILVTEEEIKQVVEEENIPVMKSHCSADKHTTRQLIKNKLNKIYKENPLIQKNIYTSLTNEKQIKLWKK